MVQDILTESFDPIVELTTGADLMMAMVYAQELGDWDYSGMYTAVLKFKVQMLKLQRGFLCMGRVCPRYSSALSVPGQK